jgi:hypothetical protein
LIVAASIVFCLLKLLLIVDRSGAADDVAFVAVVAVFVPFAALLVVGTAFPVLNVSPPDDARRDGLVLVAEILRCTRRCVGDCT